MSSPADGSASISRPTRQVLLVVVLMSFGAFTTLALAVDGITGTFHATPFNLTSIQIFIDLVLAIGLIYLRVHGKHGPVVGTRGHSWRLPGSRACSLRSSTLY